MARKDFGVAALRTGDQQTDGLFPIMNIVVVRDEILQRHPWVAQNLFKAFQEAKALCFRELRQFGAPRMTYPWVGEAMQERIEVMGENYWPYRLEENREILEAVLQYSYEQGLIRRKLPLEERFAPTTLDEFRA